MSDNNDQKPKKLGSESSVDDQKKDADLKDADLKDADLKDADLKDAGLKGEKKRKLFDRNKLAVPAVATIGVSTTANDFIGY